MCGCWNKTPIEKETLRTLRKKGDGEGTKVSWEKRREGRCLRDKLTPIVLHTEYERDILILWK